MRLIVRLILLTCLIISLISQFEDTHMRVEAQLAAGCYTFETTWDTCLTACTQIEVQQSRRSSSVSVPVIYRPALFACTTTEFLWPGGQECGQQLYADV